LSDNTLRKACYFLVTGFFVAAEKRLPMALKRSASENLRQNFVKIIQPKES